MLATLGLERVEAGLRRDIAARDDVDAFLAQAEANVVDARSRAGTDRVLHSIRQRFDEPAIPCAGYVETIPAPGLPTREYVHQLANTEFRQTRHADRV
jgi:hypothetical protein